eukprot:1176233-Prorocentrum_minimum.AAC.2
MGKYRSSVDTREPENSTKSEEYQKHLQGVLHSTRGAQNASYQRCEHPGFPGASSTCNVRVPLTYPSRVRSTGVQCGTAKGPLGGVIRNERYLRGSDTKWVK